MQFGFPFFYPELHAQSVFSHFPMFEFLFEIY